MPPTTGGSNFALPPSVSGPPSGSLFDPYAAAPASGYVPPISSAGGGTVYGGYGYGAAPVTGFSGPVTPAPQGGFLAPSPSVSPYSSGGFSTPPATPPPLFSNGGSFLGATSTTLPPVGFSSPSTYGAPAGYGSPTSPYPSAAPSTLYPGGFFGPTGTFAPPPVDPYGLIQKGRFRHTFINDDDSADALEINDTDIALAFMCQQFLWSTQPLFIAPSFSLHQWDGPQSSTGADLPANAYSAFLDFGWQSDPNRIFGAELGLSLGVFSEFDVLNSDSLRIRGKGLGTFRLTPASTLKLGVYYYDRVDTKLLPAGGLLWRPSPLTRADLFFPQPKFSRFVSTIGVNDIWWYVSGDYGGGSWTIERDGGGDDQVDINDIRVALGLEWGPTTRMRLGQRSAFFELGYVFNRELVYRYNPQDNLSLDDTWMVRLGIGY
ncbi:hypothetical protein FYK55_07715 [Roseiconus nitratireducens]|uniref:Uncharacterized protein n=2 Tax=Roseiconus nitratireducens TaxID=2605748 RepID=A0A5M6DHE5_9BACT|nr:hypothetical protein FYK55_07715 [Roseiconus nitratireducens]